MAATDLKIRCEREDLLAAIQAADAVVPTTSAKPILTNLQIDANLTDGKQGRLEIIATDLQVGLRSIIGRVEIERPGQAVVQARQLAGILKESRSRSVTMELVRKEDQSQLTIVLADGDYQIPAVVGESFPPVSFFPTDAPVVTVPANRLEEMIRQTVFAVDRDRTSAVLSGLYLAVNENEFILAATDGKVLCEAVEKGDAYKMPEATAVIVPAVTINHLHRILLATKPEKVDVAFAGKLIFLRIVTGAGAALQVELTSRLVEGNYPPYRNALPSKGTSNVVFDSSELASAVRRTALMTSNTSRGIVLTLNHDQAVLSNLNYTNGSARIPLPCTYQGAANKLGINALYLGEVLKVYKGPRIEVEISKGLIMREPGVTYLIMPISLPN
ncbi:MAG: DNA polymerase III subunit beta [Planctomycetes bacterium]|nr:DNA polymerase III subunit beta [Planctomycetota bacterium]